jgi:LPPG:FO 2-phospho-L-lactate transferase
VHGLHVSPDLDTLLYTLGGLGDEERGWGRAEETWNALDTIDRLGGATWFQLGDRDLGLHLLRTEALRRGEVLSALTERIARAVGLELALLPATDDRLRTRIRTPAGEFEFQEWFVARAHRDRVDAVVYDGAAESRAAPGVLEALEAAELIAIAPSNPFVSIGPILAVEEIRAAVERRRERVVAVSPLIGGRAVKGPADAMFSALAGGTGAGQVTDCYKGLIGALVLDEADAEDADAVAERGVRPLVTRTLMSDPAARASLVETVLGLVPAR